MDSLIAIKGKDFVIIATDSYSYSSVVKLSDTNTSKITKLSDSVALVTCSGEADRRKFGSFIEAVFNLQLYLHNSKPNVDESACFIQNQLALALRQGPFMIDGFVAGVDEGIPKLYTFDYVGTMGEANVAHHGYGGKIVAGLMDELWRKNMNIDEAKNIIEKCREEISRRFLLGQSKFYIEVVS